jgi:hypothetical protein
VSTVTRPNDRAPIGILASNALTLLAALLFDWSLVELLWPFWIQSIVIGWYARQRILRLADFSVEGVEFNGRPVDETPETQRRIANFFALHFGFFHVVYLIFLLAFTLTASSAGYVDVRNENTNEMMTVHVGNVAPLEWLIFAGLGWTFWRAHRASHEEHVEADLAGKPNIGTLMALPYARVIPMHLTIIFGVWLGGGGLAIILFVLLKTAADVGMHLAEHRWLQARATDQVRS